MNMPRFLAVGVLLAACGDKQEPTTTMVTFATFTDPSADPSGDPGGAPTTGETGATGETGLTDDTGIAPPMIEGVDVLFVIDNSGSMAEEQEKLADAMGTLVDGLPGNFRVGFTTTDSGNPRCPNTTPEGGRLVLSSCLDRVDAGEFIASDIDFSQACTAGCGLRDADLTVLPTATEQGGSAPRKWIEVVDGVSNIEGASVTEALRCYAPQGVAGCGFESHLESMYRALASSEDESSSTNFGFLRDGAALAIVIVSDEADCSYNQAYDDIFTTNKVFWFDPATDVAPSSSMCWDAGVRCSGAGPTYAGCAAESYDDEGSPGAAADAAVLHPVGRYIDFVTEIADAKQGRPVLVSLIAGVPGGYDSFDAEIPYADSPDPQFQSLFGIGPGCVVGPVDAPTATAVPPVREREFAEAFSSSSERRDVYSICDDDYSGALAAIADAISAAL
jgi:hypothetical protein